MADMELNISLAEGSAKLANDLCQMGYRAGQLDVLRELKAEFVEYDERHERSPDASLTAEEVAEWIGRKIVELEQG